MKMQNEEQMIQEQALIAFASIADTHQELFQKHFDSIVPDLKAILMNATDELDRKLGAMSMSSISSASQMWKHLVTATSTPFYIQLSLGGAACGARSTICQSPVDCGCRSCVAK